MNKQRFVRGERSTADRMARDQQGGQDPAVDKAVNDAVESPVKTAVEKPVETVDKAAEKRKIHRRRMRALRSFLFRTVALAAVIYILFFHIVGIAIMPSRDMYPRLDAGDLLLYYRLEKNPKAQDIVVIRKAEEKDGEKKSFVSRVVAKPGDTVEVSAAGLTVNGNTQIETNIFYPTDAYEGHMEYPVTLGADEYFVMADRRNGGVDSRYFGPVKQEEIQGVVITLLRRNNL